jgi:hypothetical protein
VCVCVCYGWVIGAQESSEAKLAAEHAGDCGVQAMEDQFTARKESEHSKVSSNENAWAERWADFGNLWLQSFARS